MSRLFDLRHRVQVWVLLLSFLRGILSYAVAPTSAPLSSSTSWTTASIVATESSSVSSNVSALLRCFSDNGAWQSPCGISRRRSVVEGDVETDLLGIQLFINDTINNNIFNTYIKSFDERRYLQDHAMEVFTRAFNSSSYQAKLITALKYMHAFVANVEFMSNCGLTNVVETSLKTRLESLNTRIYSSVCACVIAVRETGMNYMATSQESMLSPNILRWSKTSGDELREIELLYFILRDIERVVGLMKPWFVGSVY